MRAEPAPSSSPLPMVLWLSWGVGGVALVISNAVVRLSPVAFDALVSDLTVAQWSAAGAWLVFMLVAEGWRGFHKQFAPRVVARAYALAARGNLLQRVLLPPIAMGLVYATRKRLIVSWSLTTMIIVMIVLVRQLDQPWRGIVDFGVVAGLAAGLVSLAWHFTLGLRGTPPDVPLDFPTAN